jgi:hypothetical protein
MNRDWTGLNYAMIIVGLMVIGLVLIIAFGFS